MMFKNGVMNIDIIRIFLSFCQITPPEKKL